MRKMRNFLSDSNTFTYQFFLFVLSEKGKILVRLHPMKNYNEKTESVFYERSGVIFLRDQETRTGEKQLMVLIIIT